ncbi:Crp/Fnr family transcriptional regulator [Enterococcus sp. ALS3]|uniref:Crp/Fnr family transcriptional regulator n=1 Tax=Enterococcus alishanensis TaxID=1303817 RepID=A0ABS6THY5_9ENTE|nr:Crp/Fnr family transcriptional regulator [Enterococcus alishanensis]MBV7392400.1 Crp/Fnr family transcriptional regulator [Enterococcus alishanensis]
MDIDNLIQRYSTATLLLEYCPYKILQEIIILEFSKGEFFLNQGDIYDHVFYIVNGTVDIFIDNFKDKQIVLDSYEAGNFIGEHEIFNNQPFSSSVVSTSEIILLKIPRKQFLEWLSLDNHLNNILINSLCNQIYKLSNLVETYSLLTTKEQVCLILSQLSPDNNIISRNRLLKKISSTTRSVDRVLLELKSKHIIINSNGNIQVNDFDLLEKFGGSV